VVQYVLCHTSWALTWNYLQTSSVENSKSLSQIKFLMPKKRSNV